MDQDETKNSSAVNLPAVDNASSSSDYSHISDTGAAEVLQYTLEKSDGAIIVNGVVRNNSGEAVSPVVITIELLDANGAVVGKQETYPAGSAEFTLGPGEKAGFSLRFEDAGEGSDARISIYHEPANYQDDVPRAYEELTVSDASLDDGTLIGKVTNNGNQSATGIVVAVVLYDRKSRVLAAGEAEVEQTDLDAGAETSFSFSGPAEDSDSWDVTVSARVAE